MLSFEEYKVYFEKYGRLPNGAYVSSKGYNRVQLKSKYEKYVSSESKKEQAVRRYIKKAQSKKRHYKVDMKWEVTKQIVDGRDKKQCRLYRILNATEKRDIDKDLIGVGKRLDRAHIFGKGANPHMKYNPSNVILMYRLFHQRLDTYRHPIYDYSINSEERESIWCRIIGENNYLKLKEESIQLDKVVLS